MAEFDFSALSVEETELPAIQRGRTRSIENNPFIGPLGDSYNDGKGRQVKVPNEQYRTAVRLLRQAGTDLEIGVRIVPSLNEEQRKQAAKNKMVTIKFQGQPKRKRRSKEQLAADKAAEVQQAEPTQG